jgi:hypothetical protein
MWRGSQLYSYTILAALLVLSFGFTSAFAETIVDPDSISFNHIPSMFIPQSTPQLIDVQTGEPVVHDKSKQYILYNANQKSLLENTEKQLVSYNDIEFYLVENPLDRTANMIAVALLAIPFGLLVYRMSDEDPIPLKYAKLSGVAVAFSMVSMLTMPITTGNSYWGYASASTDTNSYFPKPVDSLYFDTGNAYLSHGASIMLDAENTAISLDGQDDYLILSSNLKEKLDPFSISAWIKPDYKKGASATLSIASSADAFDLAINNDKVEKNIATFSVFDGIKWHTVQSKTAISQEWTHISATYSNEQIKIFVNGAQEGSIQIDSDYSLTHQYGESTQNSHDYISLQSNLVIGAFNPNARDNASLSNHFSGLIDDVTLYDKLLSSENISTLDQNKRTPDTIQEPEAQSAQSEPEQTGTENEYGFVTADDNPNDQKIEEVAAEGYKVKKPEETKKKDKANQASEKAKEALEENPAVADNPQDEEVDENTSESNPTEFDTAEVTTTSNSTSTPISPPLVTPPVSEETIPDDNSLVRKLVTVSNDTQNTFADLPEIESRVQYEWKLYGDLNGTLVDLTHDPEVDLKLLDLNSNNRLDRAEWSTTDGVTEYYLVASIILATDGLHLDSNRDYVNDIFYEIKEQDDIYTYPIPEGDYVRVTFEVPIDSTRDVTVYAKSAGTTILEIYEKDGTELIATSEPIGDYPGFTKTFLTDLVGFQDTFDVLITGDPIEFDLIIDPNISYGKGVFQITKDPTNPQNEIWSGSNAGNGHNEGDWVSYQYEISGDAGDPLPSFNIVYNHHDAGSDSIFIDAFTNFRYCFDCQPLPDGTRAPPPVNGTEWENFVPLEVGRKYTEGGSNNPNVCAGVGAINEEQDFKCVKIDPSNATSYFNLNGTNGFPKTFPQTASGNSSWIIFYQAHLAMSSTWITGNEGQMGDPDSPYYIKPFENATIQRTYGTDAYLNWTTMLEFGVGATPGSSAQFKLEDQSDGPKGAITLPIPTVESDAFASITIIKDTIPEGPIDVNFTTSSNLMPNNFTLDDDGTNNNPNSNTTVYINLQEGTYSVAEEPLEGYTLVDIDCWTNNPFQGNGQSDAETNLETRNAIISLSNGDQEICKFTNVKDGTLKIVKESIGDNGTFSFISNVPGMDDFELVTDPVTRMDMIGPVNVTGVFNVTEIVPQGWILLNSTCSNGNQTDAISVGSNQDVTCTFYNEAAVGIHGQKYHDLNADGSWDIGEPSIDNWTITINGTDVGSNDDISESTLTVNNGTYWFVDLPMGNYTVCEVLQDEWINSEPGNSLCYDLDLSAGESSFGNDFGNYVNGSLHLVAFDDLNADGIWQNQTEPVWNGTFIQKKIDLFNSTDGTLISSEDIDENGTAWFLDLMPGNYTLQEDISIFDPDQVMPSPDPDGEGPILGGADMRNFTITSGQEYAWDEGEAMLPEITNKTEIVVKNQKLSFGNFIKGSLHVFAFEDKNQDGYLNNTDTAWNGTTIVKTIFLNFTDGTLVDSMNVDENGTAWFLDLMPGNYTIQEDINSLPSQVGPSPDPDGPGGVPGGAEIRNVTILSGQELAWEEGAAMLDVDSNKTEIIVDDGRLIFGNIFKNAFLKIIKNATETSILSEEGSDFTFSINGTDTETLHLNNTTFMNMTEVFEVPFGNYTVTEISSPSGWMLKDSACAVWTNQTKKEVVTNPTSTENFELGPFEYAECYFTNDNTAFINITKIITTASSDDTEPFTFNATYNNSTGVDGQDFSLIVKAGNTSNSTGLIQIPAGMTSIEEIDLPDFWMQKDAIDCSVYDYTGLGPMERSTLSHGNH